MLLNRKFIKILLDGRYKPSLNEFSNLSCSQIKWYLRIRVGRKLLRWYYLSWGVDACWIESPVKAIDVARELLYIDSGCRMRCDSSRGKIIKQPELTIGAFFPIILTKRGAIRMSWNKKGKNIKVKLYKNDSFRIRPT